MSHLLIPFLLILGIVVLFAYAWLSCWAEQQQQDKLLQPLGRHFNWQLAVSGSWLWTYCSKRLTLAVNDRRIIVEVASWGGNLLHVYHQRRCPGCGEWQSPSVFVLSVWGREECGICAEHAAYAFFQVSEHYGYAGDLPAPGAWIPQALAAEYSEYFRNVVW